MRAVYICEICRHEVAEIDLNRVEPARLGLGTLTPEEQADIISLDLRTGTVIVMSFCDNCVGEAQALGAPVGLVH